MTVAFAARYPRTVAAFSAMGALDQLERIARLDAAWDTIRRGEQSDHQHDAPYTQSAICNLQLIMI
jgi:hypothetical protein